MKGFNVKAIECILDWVKLKYIDKYVPKNTSPKKKTATSFLFPEDNLQKSFNEIENYKKEEEICKDADPLNWWHQNLFRYPILSEIAISYLCIPATSTPSERVFSAAGNIVSAKRSCLSPENVNKLVFLTQNKHI